MKSILILFFICFNAFSQIDSRELDVLDKLMQNPLTVVQLDLSEKDLHELPEQILNFKNLRGIDLSKNPNLDFYQTFEILKQLQYLDKVELEDCKIKVLPDNTGELKSLTQLILPGNEIESLPNGIRKLDNLTYLDLFENKIQSLDFKPEDLKNLADIRLCYNKFKVFPISLNNLQNLRKIIIWYNDIEYIPNGISDFKNLEELNLDNNNLSTIPEEISKLKSLKILSLRSNNLSAKTNKVIFKIQNLENLDLEKNLFTSIPSKLKNLKNIKRLNFSENPIKSIPKEIIQLKHLEQVGLGGLHNFNWEETFKILSQIPSLERVGMYRMEKQTMPNGFENLQQVKTFWLTFNLFNKAEKERIRKLVPNAKVDFY